MAKAAPRTVSLGNFEDLTQTLDGDFPVIPVPGLTFPFRLKKSATLEKHGVYNNIWETIEHIGTHIDAPCHFIDGQSHLDSLPVREMIVPAVVLDIREKARKDRDYLVTPDDILAWEKRHGRMPEGACLLMYSGWDAKATDPKDFLGMDSSQTMHFPGIPIVTAEFLLNERRIVGLGVDTISFDPGPDKEYKTHKVWFRAGKWGVENVNNLGKIPPSGATVFIGAPKVAHASGAPCRILAVW
jgi:kynurenine formamidase